MTILQKTNVKPQNIVIYLIKKIFNGGTVVKGHGFKALVREDAACRGATKPMRHSY